jgi:hypothetical protein
MTARSGGALLCSCALHAALALWLCLPLAPARGDRAVKVVLLPPNESTAYPGLKPLDASDSARATAAFDPNASLAGANLERIASHLAVLFPFVTPGLALDALFQTTASPSRLVFENPYAPPNASRVHRDRVNFDDAALHALVDKTWTRTNRWNAFAAIRDTTDAYDADDVGLARLIALYREENALQPYADGAVRDLRLWAQLGLAADHVTFVGFIRDYSRAHRSSKVTTELLLLLDTVAEANGDALATLVETNEGGDLEWTRRTAPRAYQLARQIQSRYRRELDDRRHDSRQAQVHDLLSGTLDATVPDILHDARDHDRTVARPPNNKAATHYIDHAKEVSREGLVDDRDRHSIRAIRCVEVPAGEQGHAQRAHEPGPRIAETAPGRARETRNVEDQVHADTGAHRTIRVRHGLDARQGSKRRYCLAQVRGRMRAVEASESRIHPDRQQTFRPDTDIDAMEVRQRLQQEGRAADERDGEGDLRGQQHLRQARRPWTPNVAQRLLGIRRRGVQDRPSADREPDDH